MVKSFSRAEFSKALFNCHNIIRDNDKLSPEAAFDEISKILFIKMRKERDSIKGVYTESVYAKEKDFYNRTNKSLTDFYQSLFLEIKDLYVADGLFEKYERMKIREYSFEMIIKELQKFNLSKTSADIKGIAFEEFLGTTFRGELGQFFTPRTVVDFMVDVLDPQENDLICDPCCGSGGFLIKTFQYVRDFIQRDKKLSSKEKSEKIQHFAAHNIFGTDANPRMARTAKMNMIMHGDGHCGIHHHDGLLNVNGIFEERFNVILTNPPFGSHINKTLLITEADRFTDEGLIARYKKKYGERYDVAMQQITKNIQKPILSLYETGKMSGLTEVLFIERCLNLLAPGGRLGIVLPEGVLDGNKLHKVRQYVESRARIILVVSLPQEVFMKSGASVKPSILFLRKFTQEEKKNYDNISDSARNEIEAKYSTALLNIQKGKAADSGEQKRHYVAEERLLRQKIESEQYALVKRRFNYDIPMAKVDKAGIGSRGEITENELEALSAEYKKYRVKKHLW